MTCHRTASNHSATSKSFHTMANISRYYPANSAKSFPGNFFTDFLNHSLSDFVGADSVIHQPGVNVLETTDAFRLEIAAPGFDKQDFSIHVEGNQLTVGANRENATEDKQERFMRREFHYSSFKRSFNLPDSVNQNGVTAVYSNGILHVTLPKKDEAKPVVKTVEIG